MIHFGNHVRHVSTALFLGMILVLSACSSSGLSGSDQLDGSDGPTGPYNLGNDAQFSDTSPYASGVIHLIKIEVPNSTTIQSVSMFARRYLFTIPADVRMSVYTDSGGYADKLVVGSGVQTTLTDDLQLLTFDVADTPIAAGTYWVGFNADVDISVSSDPSLSAKDVCSVNSVATSDPWPADPTSPSRSTHVENNLNVFMTVVD